MSERLSQREYFKVKAQEGLLVLALLSTLNRLFPKTQAIENQEIQPIVPNLPVRSSSYLPEQVEAKPALAHVVQPGENLFRIALKYGTTIEELARINNIANPAQIEVGQKIILPEYTSPEETPINFSPERIIVDEPEDYNLTYKDRRFLSWFNEKTMFWNDWNGKRHQLFIPEDVYRDAKTAEVASGLPWYCLVAIGFTETGYYDWARWNPDVTSSSGAQGRYQIMPFNWVFQPYEGSLYNPKLNALTAANYMLYLELGDIDIDKETWIWRFTGGNNSRPCWNLHQGQAEVTWEIMQYLKKDYFYALEHVK